MGQYGITSGVIGKALPIGGGDAAITPASAWLFENQTGTLGTNLTGSQIYSGSGGSIIAILSGVNGVLGVAFTGNMISNGTGYTVNETGVAVTSASGLGTGLTVDTVVADGGITSIAVNTAGVGYRQGDVITVTSGDGNATFTVNVTDALPIAGDAVTFTNVPAGTILPIAVDYVLNSSTATDMVACK
tara:strand:+ start:391 stop:954 length:564 start_codon:yes stop_codon:yes gene_type:complete